MDLAPLDTTKILQFCAGERTLFEHQLGGLTTGEIAKQERVSATAIRVRLLRARRDVRARLAERAAGRRQSTAYARA